MKFKSALLALALSASFSAFATVGVPITANLQASSITVNASTSLKGLAVSYSNVSAGGSHTKKITSVAYSLVKYPVQGGVETVQICYTLPNQSAIGYCQNVLPGTAGSLTAFNLLAFDAYATVWIRHTVTGGTFPTGTPSARDSLTINWSY